MSNALDSLNLAASADSLPLELLHPLDGSNPVSTPDCRSSPEQRPIVTPDPGVTGGDGDGVWLPPSQLLISKDGQSRSIWPVHLAGWQALGWQLQHPAHDTGAGPDAGSANGTDGSAAGEGAVPDQELVQAAPVEGQVGTGESSLKPAPEPDLEPEPGLEPAESTSANPPDATAGASPPEGAISTGEIASSSSGEALLAAEATDFQAMTKAQIVEFCSTVYGVELDGSQTKAELVEQATALEAQASATGSTTQATALTSDGSSDAADLAAQELGDALL